MQAQSQLIHQMLEMWSREKGIGFDFVPANPNIPCEPESIHVSTSVLEDTSIILYSQPKLRCS